MPALSRCLPWAPQCILRCGPQPDDRQAKLPSLVRPALSDADVAGGGRDAVEKCEEEGTVVAADGCRACVRSA
ncbi:hypothetical protein B0T36_25170 [Nocardia donostiensis]|nr:hypothetical protein B0T36_25170 [Nocardia donostiensis]